MNSYSYMTIYYHIILCNHNFNILIHLLLIAAKVLTHGISVPYDTPVQWMSEHMSYLDNFLHLVLV